MPQQPTTSDFLERAPGHARVVGVPGSGKTTLLVERYRALAARGHRPGIVAFGREQQDRLLDLVLPPGSALLGTSPVTTHGLIASALVAAAHPSRARTLRDVDERVVLGRLLRREPALLTSDLGSIVSSQTFQRHLLEAIHALAQHGITAADARARADACDHRSRDVLVVYARYRDQCDARGLVTFYDLAWRAAEAYDAGGVASPLAGFDTVLVDDFHDLDPGQFHLLTRLVPAGGAASLEVFGDPTGARFSFRGTTDRFFREEFPARYAPEEVCLTPPVASDGALFETVAALLELTSDAGTPKLPAADLPLFATARTPAQVVARTAWNAATTMVNADDEIAEAQWVAQRAREVLAGGVAAADVAIVARDPDRYRSALLLACHEWGVPVDAGHDGHTATDDFLRSLFGALGSDSDGHFAESLAASPFCAPLLDAVQVSRSGDGARMDTVVRSLRRAHESRGGAFDLEGLVREHVTPLMPAAGAGMRPVVSAAVDEWRRYNEVVEHAGGGASLDEFRAAYFADAHAPVVGATRIALLSPREAAGRTFRVVFVMGCADGFFPGGTVRDGYLSMRSLARALEPVSPTTARDLAARFDDTAVERSEFALFLTALTRASETLFISVPEKIAGETTAPARVLAAFAQTGRIEHVGRAQSPCAHAARALAAAPASMGLSARLYPIDRLSGWWVALMPAPRLPALGTFSMSASKLESFTRCERKFFYSKVLRMQEPDSIYLKIGTLVHDALKEIIPAGASGDEVRLALRAPGARDVVERLIAAAMPDDGAWLRELSVQYMDEILRRVAELESERAGDYRVRSVEQAVDVVIEGMPLRGRFDRIDDVSGLGPVIIDYKTSMDFDKSHRTIVKKLEDAPNRKYWQIPVYAVAAETEGVAPAAFVYYVLRPGEDSFATGVQVARGSHPAPIDMGPRGHPRYGPVAPEAIASAMAHALRIHHSIVAGECRYERTSNLGECANCHFARICQRTRASN